MSRKVIRLDCVYNIKYLRERDSGRVRGLQGVRMKDMEEYFKCTKWVEK